MTPRKLLGFRFHHQNRVRRAGDDEIEIAFDHLVDHRVELVFAVDVADARAADRTHEGQARNRQGGGNRDHRDDVGIVLHVVADDGDDDLRLVLEALGKERTDRTVDQARNERFLFARTAFTLEEAARDLAGGVGLFLVVHGQRKEVEAGLGLPLADDGCEHGGLAIGREHGAIGLAGDLARLQDERATTPFNFFACDIKHIYFLFRAAAFFAFLPSSGGRRSFLPLTSRPDIYGASAREARYLRHASSPRDLKP